MLLMMSSLLHHINKALIVATLVNHNDGVIEYILNGLMPILPELKIELS